MSLIELKNISKTYHMGTIEVQALKDISLEISEGEFVAIMGHSGSGKSTLMHILGLLDKPSGGKYTLSGKVVSDLTDDDLASLRNKYLGFVFQQFNLLSRMTALENVALPLVYSDNKQRSNKELQLLEMVGLADRVNHKPNELSGGQQQRVAIARSLMNNPLVVFADEPTGNLDTKSSIEIMDILKKLNDDGITVIMVTHEPDIAKFANRMIRVSDGLIVSDEKKKTRTREGHVSAPRAEIHKAFNLQRIKDYFVQAMRALSSNKTRSVLSILGVLIGVASLIAMLALGTGAQENVKKSISALGSNLLYVQSGARRAGGVTLGVGSVTRLSLQDALSIRDRIGGINLISPNVNTRGQVTYSGNNWNTQIQGTSADYPAIRSAVPTQGRFFTADEATSRAKVALIGLTVKKNLFTGGEDPIGKFIRIQKIDFQIIGILPPKGATGFRDNDDIVVIPVNTGMYRLMGKQFIDSIDVQVKNADDMDDISDKIKNLLTANHRLPASRKDEIDVRNMADIQQAITQTAKTFSFLLGSIAFISLLVGGIGIMNIMLVSVTERTREIGIRKAVGANNKDILFQFVIEAVVVCLIGGIMGVILGAGISLSLSKLAGWTTVVSWYSVVLAIFFSGATGLIFGVWPAKKASDLDPIEALRYE